MLEENEIIQLKKFYNKLYDNYILKYKKLKSNSLLISFIDIKANDRFRLLTESSIKPISIPGLELKNLKLNKYVRNSDNSNNLSITGKGVFEIENQCNKISIEKLINCLDEKLFSLFTELEKNLSDKQKVILFSMISARSFSEDSAVDLQRNEKINETWGAIVDESFHFLKDIGIIKKLSEKELYGKKGNEHPVSNVFRHTDQLPRLTGGIFTALGNQKYFLNVYIDNSISKEGLLFILRKIFEGISLDIVNIQKISDFCRDIAHTKDTMIFDPKKHIFSGHTYDYFIKDLLIQI
jgi:hypothetical protein